MNDFGSILKELRIEKKLSQAQLAQATSITQSSIARWELNKSEPQLSQIRVLACYFNISADVLIGIEGIPYATTFNDRANNIHAPHSSIVINQNNGERK